MILNHLQPPNMIWFKVVPYIKYEAPDGSEDEKINIIGLEDYSVESDNDEDPFWDEEHDESEDEAED